MKTTSKGTSRRTVAATRQLTLENMETAPDEQTLVLRWRLKNIDKVPPYTVHDDKSIRGFFGEYRFLSNFWPGKVEHEGLVYPSVEHAFHAAKYPPAERLPFTSLKMSPAKARSLGCDAPVDPETWWNSCVAIMEKLVQYKFEHNPALRERLLATAPKYLEERNHWDDTFWGVCRGEGENQLGQILMRVRERLLAMSADPNPLTGATLPSLTKKRLSGSA